MTSTPLLNLVSEDAAFEAVLGEELGRGAGRTAFAHNADASLVLRVGKAAPFTSNLTEWLIWNQIENEPKLVALFGRCTAMSVSGRYLVMERLNFLIPRMVEAVGDRNLRFQGM